MRSQGWILTVALLSGATFALAMGRAVAQDTGMPPQLIVKWKSRAQLQDSTVSAASALRGIQDRFGTALRSMRTLSTGGEVIRMSERLSDAQMEDLIARLVDSGAVEYAEVDQVFQTAFTPNDPLYAQQWHYFEAAGGVRLPAAWDFATGSGVRVGVVDTGIRPHEDLNGNIVKGYDFISDPFIANDGNGRDSDPTDPGDFNLEGQCGPARNSSFHGVRIAGTIAALANNSVGVAGVAFNSKVVPLRAFGRCGGLLSDIADAIVWGSGGSVAGVPANANPARVVNLSMSGGGPCSTTMQNAINSARSRNAVVVVAAGNSNINISNSTPANCAGVIVVAATARNGGKAPYSGVGSIVDVAAPGGDTLLSAANGVLSTGPGGYEFYQGTSMAAAHVSGVAALMLSANSNLTTAQVESVLKNTARPFPIACSGCGTGIVNAFAAVQGALPTSPTTSSLTNGVPVSNLSGVTGAEQRFTLVVPSGASNLSIAMSGGSGDADLYVRLGSPPTTSVFECRPFLSGNNETCSAATPAPGTYHILIRGFTEYAAVTLRGSFQ